MEGFLGPGQVNTLPRALLCSVALMTAPAMACINSYETELTFLFQRGDKEGIAKLIASLDAKFAALKTLETGNDRAVARIMVGRYDEAIKLLHELEKLNPGKAIVAANLGTALELAGNDAEALRWIREGVRRDPAEHRGTEWLHVKILEAKLQRAGDPRWLESHNILGLDFGAAPRPIMPKTLPLDVSGKPLSVEKILKAIGYQLGERRLFVGPPDAIMADMQETGANLRYAAHYAGLKLGDFRGNPRYGYEQAQFYGPADQQRIQLRLRQFETDFPGRAWQDHKAN
jgi:tetratricopeptide (TPR) repeat protein